SGRGGTAGDRRFGDSEAQPQDSRATWRLGASVLFFSGDRERAAGGTEPRGSARPCGIPVDLGCSGGLGFVLHFCLGEGESPDLRDRRGCGTRGCLYHSDSMASLSPTRSSRFGSANCFSFKDMRGLGKSIETLRPAVLRGPYPERL